MIEIAGYDIRYVRTTPKKNKKKVIENELWVVRTENNLTKTKRMDRRKRRKEKKKPSEHKSLWGWS